LEAEIISSELRGEAREAGKWLAERERILKSQRSRGSSFKVHHLRRRDNRHCQGKGLGGRNMELALAFAMDKWN